MPRPRAGHAAALGYDGNIYVVGGDNQQHQWLEIDAYDPEGNSWSLSAWELLKGRSLHDVVGLGTQLLAIGGVTVAGKTSAMLFEVDCFDLAARSRIQRPATKTTRKDLAAAALGGTVHAIWGAKGGNAVHTEINDDIETLEPGTLDAGSWVKRKTPESVKPRWGARAVTLGDRVYVLGGFGPVDLVGSTADLPGWGASRQVAFFDQEGNWGVAADLLLSRNVGAAAAGLDGRIYYMGGTDEDGRARADVEAYDPATDQWRFVRSMPEARFDMRAVAARDGRIYVFGGVEQHVAGVEARDSVLVYDPELDRWFW